MSRRDDGSLGATIVEPYGDYFADARNKRVALADFAENHGDHLVRIESISKTSTGLPVARPEAGIGAALSPVVPAGGGGVALRTAARHAVRRCTSHADETSQAGQPMTEATGSAPTAGLLSVAVYEERRERSNLTA